MQKAVNKLFRYRRLLKVHFTNIFTTAIFEFNRPNLVPGIMYTQIKAASLSSQNPTETTPADKMSKITVEVCKESELVDGGAGMRQVKLGEFPVLVGRTSNRLFAVGGRCAHFGLPLANGQLSEAHQHIRCPFHGACFNVFTGDIEDSPGQDCLPTFDVSVRDGTIVVEGAPPADGKFTVVRPMCRSQPEFAQESYVIIGGGPAAVAAADGLRREGFRGRLTILSSESLAPYDRVKLSKFMSAEPTFLRSAEHYAQYDIQLTLDSQVTAVNPGERIVEVESKNGKLVVPYTKLLVCSGSTPRQLTIETPKIGVYYLRQHSDAKQIHELGQGSDVVLIGSSFIALETAAYLTNNGAKSVTVLARDQIPFKALFGEQIGTAVRKLHESKGVKFVIGELDSFTSDGEGRLSGLKLKSGDSLPAQLCVVGIGAAPNTQFLPARLLRDGQAGAPLVVGPDMSAPSEPHIYGAGDVLGYGHWQTAQNQGRLVAKSMLGKKIKQPLSTFFWTMMFGTSVRYAALAAGGDGRPSQPWKRVVLSDNPPVEELKFGAYLVGEGDLVVAGVSIGSGPGPVALANELAKGEPIPLKTLVAA